MRNFLFKRIFGCAVLAGLILNVSVARGEESVWQEEPMEVVRGAEMKLPKEFGRLVSVVESGDVHHLYFQDAEGNVRIMLLGQPGSVVRARRELNVLSPTVYVLEQGAAKIIRADDKSDYR